MSWSLRKADVKLAVTRFLPEVAPASPPEAKPVAGLSPIVRALFRDRRARECKKVAPALELDDPEKHMCTCHGFDRVAEYCIDFCGKTRP
jgi:hypothetical protein